MVVGIFDVGFARSLVVGVEYFGFYL
jgi:hypothetical protein